jgi:hypothetical protein
VGQGFIRTGTKKKRGLLRPGFGVTVCGADSNLVIHRPKNASMYRHGAATQAEYGGGRPRPATRAARRTHAHLAISLYPLVVL